MKEKSREENKKRPVRQRVQVMLEVKAVEKQKVDQINPTRNPEEENYNNRQEKGKIIKETAFELNLKPQKRI